MSKVKPKQNFGEEELKEIQEDPEVQLDDVDNENFKTEFSRNLLHKNIYEKNTIDPALRDRMNIGKRVTVPVFYEEEQLFKTAAAASIDEQGRVYSLNDFIRVAVVKAAYDVLGKEEADNILKQQFNLLRTVPTSDAERQKEHAKRKQEKSSASRSDAHQYPRDPAKKRKRKSPDELASRGRKSNTKPVVV